MSERQPAIQLDYDPRPRRVSSAAIKSFTLGILCLPFMLIIGVGVFPAVFAIHLGRIALDEMREDTSYDGRNLAIAGIVLGIVGLAGFAVVVGLAIILGGS